MKALLKNWTEEKINDILHSRNERARQMKEKQMKEKQMKEREHNKITNEWKSKKLNERNYKRKMTKKKK